jgi:hypothetical protein
MIEAAMTTTTAPPPSPPTSSATIRQSSGGSCSREYHAVATMVDKEFDVSVNLFCWVLSCPFSFGAIPFRKCTTAFEDENVSLQMFCFLVWLSKCLSNERTLSHTQPVVTLGCIVFYVVPLPAIFFPMGAHWFFILNDGCGWDV